MTEVLVRLTGRQHKSLKEHLYPGDGKEAVALLLAGRRAGSERHVLCVRELLLIPHEECFDRSIDEVRWPTTRLHERLPSIGQKNLAVIKVHSHPGGFEEFSIRDDSADRELYGSLFGWTDTADPHASMVMLPSGELFGRAIWPGVRFSELASILVAGDDLSFWFPAGETAPIAASLLRNEQAFGKGTMNLLRRLRVGVLGCSGTGSPVIEQLARLGVGALVLVDPEVVEEKNLNRIINSTWDDATQQRPKVEVLRRAIKSMGLGTKVVPLQEELNRPNVVRELAGCDVLFGCVDSVDGRQLLNRLATFYSIPYFDVGVRLVADGRGGISHICGSVHYLQPDGSSLMSRGAISEELVRAEAMRRESPEEFEDLRSEGYIAGVAEDRPAVLPVNMLFAALSVNEFLARIHDYRHEPNAGYAKLMLSLEQVHFYSDGDGDPCPGLAKHVGRGDVNPLLDRPALSER